MVKFFILKGDFLDRLKDIKKGHKVTEKGFFVVVSDKDGREAVRHYIPRNSIIQVSDNDAVERATVV